MEELHRLAYAQSSCLYTILRATWITLIRTVVLLAARLHMVITVLLMQSLEICHIYEFSNASAKLMTVLTYLWSASLKTCGERVRDFSTSASPGRALSKSDGCQQLFYYVGKSLSNKSLKGLVELLGLESQISGSLDFIYNIDNQISSGSKDNNTYRLQENNNGGLVMEDMHYGPCKNCTSSNQTHDVLQKST
ncbi:hypothetical protein YC2023_107390 [Brassica napus]